MKVLCMCVCVGVSVCISGDVWLSVLKAQIGCLCVNPFLSLCQRAPIRQLCLAAHREAHIELAVCNYLQNDDWWSHMGKGMRTRDKSRQDNLGTTENDRFVRPESCISPSHTHTPHTLTQKHLYLFLSRWYRYRRFTWHATSKSFWRGEDRFVLCK